MEDGNVRRVERILKTSLPLFGFCPFEAIADRLLSCRAAARLPEAARTVVVCLFPYRWPHEGARNLSRYACVPDYHRAAGGLLQQAAAALQKAFPRERFVPFIDNSPVPEVRTAALAGLGAVGDNGLLIHPVYGSWVFIGELVTTLSLPSGGPDTPPGCLHCGRCAAGCPSGCIGAEGSGGEPCLSAITQKKGTLTPREEGLLRTSPLVWGCDACQEVCPLNAGTVCAPHPCFDSYSPLLTEAGLEDWRDKPWGWRGREVPARNLRLKGGSD